MANIGLAERASAGVPPARRDQARLLLRIVWLLTARQRGNLPAEAAEAQRPDAMAWEPAAGGSALGTELLPGPAAARPARPARPPGSPARLARIRVPHAGCPHDHEGSAAD
jgi:hypothetical protein